MQNWKEVESLLEKPKKVVILSHRSPDGDSIGSSLGIGLFLEQINHQIQVITPDPAPKFLNWMKGFDSIINFVKDQKKVEESIQEAEVLICLDFNTLSRMGSELEEVVRTNNQAYIINIDHHQEPDDFAHFQLSDTTASSTAQLVFDFINMVGGKKFVTKEIGECLYTGIMTDTGSFRFSSTSANTHRVAADLIEAGIEPSGIHQKVYDSYSVDRLKLLGFALNERFNVYSKFKTGIIYLSEKDLSQFNFQKGDTEGLVNFPLSIESIVISILITEKDGKVKMSFRSKGNFHINEMAKEYFNGGGHFNAAGGISELSVMETVKKIEDILPKYESQL